MIVHCWNANVSLQIRLEDSSRLPRLCRRVKRKSDSNMRRRRLSLPGFVRQIWNLHHELKILLRGPSRLKPELRNLLRCSGLRQRPLSRPKL